MDPDANLRQQLELAQAITNGEADEIDIHMLAELVLALDEWIDRGGHMPARWTR